MNESPLPGRHAACRNAALVCAVVFLLVATLLAAPPAAGQAAMQGDRVAVGDTAGEFSLQSIDGETFSLSSLRGDKSALLIFFRGTW